MNSPAKILAELTALPANRCCADCQSTLVDSSQVYTAMSPVVEIPNSRYNMFLWNHAKFNPNYSESMSQEADLPVDPALLAADRTGGGGHGVFVCPMCAAAHQLLGKTISVVRAVQDPSAWDLETAKRLKASGGNARARTVLEAFVPAAWKARRPTGDTIELAERLTFVRAKYEALAFCLPPSGAIAGDAWESIIGMHPEWEGLWHARLHHLSDLELGVEGTSWDDMDAITATKLGTSPRAAQLPNRLVDFFCVVTASPYLEEEGSSFTSDMVSQPDEWRLVPIVSDCYPNMDAFEDTEFPGHVATLACPRGCRVSTTSSAPSFFSLVLTTGSGDRLYAGVLRLYDDNYDGSLLNEILRNSGKTEISGGNLPDVVYLPKCLVVLSHYPFWDLWRKFLLQLYRIALVEAPLPMERFVANFCSEVPLPPPGRIQVQFGFVAKDIWRIQRPAENQLPMANISFKPLFACLSVNNILTVTACLLREFRVALCSQHTAILTPVAEAFLSLLFPFHWQGMYLPVTPDHMAEDIVQAPVPFLIGMHHLPPLKRRPRGVVFVDLDKDCIHLGFEDDSMEPRDLPSLPDKATTKLRTKLEHFAGSIAYVAPPTGKKGTVTTGHGIELASETVDLSAQGISRKHIFSNVDKAYKDNELLVPLTGFLSERGQYNERVVVSPGNNDSGRKKALRLRLVGSLQRSGSNESGEVADVQHDHLLDLSEPEGFSSVEIRNAFLRFFVSVLRDYRQYMDNNTFRSAEFLSSLQPQYANSTFVAELLKTQLFERFVEDRRDNSSDPEVLFFDDSITAKRNRSKKQALANMGRKKATEFLNDTSAVITDSYTPPPPSNLGLPDDGRSYHYGSFPKLDPNLFGKVRPPADWPRYRSIRISRRASIRAQASEQAVLVRAMAPVIKVTKRGKRNLEAAIGALSSAFATPQSYRSKKSKAQTAWPDKSSDISELTLPSAFMTADVVSSAEEVVLNARRKQSILMGILIKLQAVCRGHLARKYYRMSHFGGRESLLQRHSSGKGGDIRIASNSSAVVRLQAWIRGKLQREWFFKCKTGAVLVQATVRGLAIRHSYLALLDKIVRVQATWRGLCLRSMMRRFCEGQFQLYRKYIFALWRIFHTPLCYRTTFWSISRHNVDFLHLAVLNSEAVRLLTESRPILEAKAKICLSEKELKHKDLAERLGIPNATFQMTQKASSAVPKEAGTVSGRRRGSRLDKGNGSLSNSLKERETAERLQVYERLSLLREDILVNHFRRFSVPLKDKRKKSMLAERIWQQFEEADVSMKLMLELFPELSDSYNIHFSEPSKKGLRRFRPAIPIPSPLDSTYGAQFLLRGRTQRNVAEVAGVCFGLLAHYQPSRKRTPSFPYEGEKVKAIFRPQSQSNSSTQPKVLQENGNPTHETSKLGITADPQYPGDEFWLDDAKRIHQGC